MLFRLTHYCTALVFLVALSVVYRNVVAPLTTPPLVDVVAISTAENTDTDDSLDDLFADGSWQRGPCKQLHTSSGILLFENWKQIRDDQWKLWPVTVIIGRGMSGQTNTSPVVIEAAEGAEIKFTKSLDVMSGGAPPIHRGRIIGSVHIYRNDASQPGRVLDLQTANVGIDNQKIWTTESIEMKVGRARCIGRDLTIHLAAPTNPGSGGADILDRMELIYLDEFTMPLRDGGLWQDLEGRPQPAEGQVVAGTAAAPAMVSLRCGGRVEYDFALDQLLLNDSVSLVHQVPGSLPDRFDCDWLQLTLNDPANDRIVRTTPLDWLIGIIASGSPAVAKLPSFDAELAAEEINFNAVDGVIQADGRNGIQVRRGGITARLAQLIYEFDPKNPDNILSIDAPGAGRVVVDDPGIPVRKAHWQNGFRFWPVKAAITRDIETDVQLRIEGDVHAFLSDGGEFRAESITGFLTPEPNPNKPGGPNTLVPDRFEISGNVRIDTTAIAAETQRLLLFFISEQDPPGDSVSDDASTGQSPLRRWVSQPGEEGQMVDPVARPRPVIRGDVISAQLRRNQSGLSAKKLSVTGSVEVLHQLKTGGQTLPAKLTGEHLQLIDGGGEDVLQLGSGIDSPARFELGDGFFIGPQIQIRPSDNVVWINDAGEFQMPTAALPAAVADGSSLRWTRAPHCRWQGEMIFDGRTAVLSDGVDLTASLINGHEHWELHMTGDRLQVDLLEDVQVRNVDAMRGAQIQRISLLQNKDRPVLVQALRRAGDGVLEAKHLIHASALMLTPADGGRLIGKGPGWYRGWMLPQSSDNLLGVGGADTRLIDANETGLTGVHLVFNDSMQADLANRNLDFLRGVRVGVRTVSDWKAAFDARAMDAISMGDSTLDCDRLRFTVEPGFAPGGQRVSGVPTPWELEATSGVVFRTRNERGLLEGTASRASYSSSKDLFTVEGAPNRAAIFRQTLPDGSKGPEGAVRTMSIRPKTMKIEKAVLERLNMATPPGGANR